MATLTRETIQALAVLRAVSEWNSGAFGPVRIHKTLFFADKENADWRFFTFKKWWLGQFSDTVSETLNRLHRAGRIHSEYSGPSERIIADISRSARKSIHRFFRDYFPAWDCAFRSSFKKWAYLTNDDIIVKAHDDPTYKKSRHGEEIFRSRIPELVQFEELSEDDAEEMTDLVDGTLWNELKARLHRAVEKPAKAEDWRAIYFSEDD